jgi:hypothetical protein
MKKIAFLLLLLAGFTSAAIAQTDNTFYAKEYPGATVGQKIAAAQASCNPNAAIPCIIVIDPSLATWAAGSMPSQCGQCSWVDYRTGAPTGGGTAGALLKTGGAMSGALTAPAVNSELNAASCGGTTPAAWCPTTGTQDVGNWINAACASLPNGGGVLIPANTTPYQYQTPISISTACNVYGQGKGATVLQFTPSTGTAISYIQGNDSSPAAFGLRDLTLLGPGGAYGSYSATGLYVSYPGFKAQNVEIGGFVPGTGTRLPFHIGVTFGSNAYLDYFADMNIWQNDQALVYPDGLTNSGENISFVNSTFSNGNITDSASSGLNCVSILPSNAVKNVEMNFVNTSFDGCQVVIGANTMQVRFVNPHFEDIESSTDYPFLVVNAANTNRSNVTLVSPTFFVDASSYTSPSLVSIEGYARVSVNSGATYFGYGGTSEPTIAPFYISGAGNAQLSLSGIFTGNIAGLFPTLVGGNNGIASYYSTDGVNAPSIHVQPPASTSAVGVPSGGGTFVLAQPTATNVPNSFVSGEYRISYYGPNRIDLWDVYLASSNYASSVEMTVLSHWDYQGTQVITPEVVGNAPAGSQTASQLVAVVANTGGNPGTLTVQWLGDGFSEQIVLPGSTTAFTNVIPTTSYLSSGGSGSNPVSSNVRGSATWNSGGSAVQGNPGGVVNAVVAGADPTGATDSTSAINAAITSLASTGGTLYLPAGTYKTTGIALASGVTLEGEAPQLTTPANVAPDIHMAPSGGTWLNCTSTNCLTGSGLRESNLAHLGFENWTGQAILIGGNNVDGLSFANWEDLVFIGSATVNGSDTGIQISNFQHISGSGIRIFDVNTCGNFINQTEYFAGGNSEFTGFYCFTYPKSAANSNAAKPGLLLQVLAPAAGSAAGLNYMTFTRPQVNSYNGDGTGTDIAIQGISGAGVIGTRMLSVDIEGTYTHGIYQQFTSNSLVEVTALNQQTSGAITFFLDSNATSNVSESTSTVTTYSSATGNNIYNGNLNSITQTNIFGLVETAAGQLDLSLNGGSVGNGSNFGSLGIFTPGTGTTANVISRNRGDAVPTLSVQQQQSTGTGPALQTTAAGSVSDQADFGANTKVLNGGTVQLPGINQSSANSTGGTCAMSTGTTCTITIGHTYTSPTCIATVQGSTALAGACSVSGVTVTVTAASSNSATWGAFVFGNPN